VKRATVTKAFGDNGTIKEPDTHGVFDFCNDISPAVWPKIVHKDIDAIKISCLPIISPKYDK